VSYPEVQRSGDVHARTDVLCFFRGRSFQCIFLLAALLCLTGWLGGIRLRGKIAEEGAERTAEILERYDHSVSNDKAIENHYPTLSVEEIAELPVPDICTESAVLYLWVTNPKLKDGLYILDRWGFQYRTNICWVKEFNGLGIGYWARSRHELLLIGTKGDIPCPTPNVRPESVISSKRNRHSQKPDDFFKIIESAYPTLPKCELFSRKKRKGWKCWGNEIL